MYKEEGEAAPLKQHSDSPGGDEPQQQALADGLQENGERHQGGT